MNITGARFSGSALPLALVKTLENAEKLGESTILLGERMISGIRAQYSLCDQLPLPNEGPIRTKAWTR